MARDESNKTDQAEASEAGLEIRARDLPAAGFFILLGIGVGSVNGDWFIPLMTTLYGLSRCVRWQGQRIGESSETTTRDGEADAPSVFTRLGAMAGAVLSGPIVGFVVWVVIGSAGIGLPFFTTIGIVTGILAILAGLYPRSIFRFYGP